MTRMPPEFAALPTLLPPSATDGSLPEWTVAQDWVSPAFCGRRIALRAGFRTDGASIPRPFWVTIGHPFTFPILGPALCHDALYAGELASRERADWLFLCWLQQVGVSWSKRNRIWLAVRIGGGVVWRRHTADGVRRSRKYCQLIDENEPVILWPDNGEYDP